jgi:hypothetical protein
MYVYLSRFCSTRGFRGVLGILVLAFYLAHTDRDDSSEKMEFGR